jgi:hypothetical protein
MPVLPDGNHRYVAGASLEASLPCLARGHLIMRSVHRARARVLSREL